MFSKFLSKHPFPHRLLFINLISSFFQCFPTIFSISIIFQFSFFFVSEWFFRYSLDYALSDFMWFFSRFIFNFLRWFSSYSSLLSTSNISIFSLECFSSIFSSHFPCLSFYDFCNVSIFNNTPIFVFHNLDIELAAYIHPFLHNFHTY